MVRPATPGDSAVLADIHISSWQTAYQGVFPAGFLEGLDRERRTARFDVQISQGASILVEPDDKPRGFCWFGEPLAAEEGNWVELYAIYVHPSAWGEGHGYRLLRAAQAEMTATGFPRAFLWVLDVNDRARRFYERQGWELTSRLKLEEIGETPVTEVRYEISLGSDP